MREKYRKRFILHPPNIKNFKPGHIRGHRLKKIYSTIDEYEAIRLADYLRLDHKTAATRMKISRPTFSRLIATARNKIAMALIEGREIIFEGGNYEFINTLHRCLDCGDEKIQPVATTICECTNCGSENLEDVAKNFNSTSNIR